MKLQHLIIIFAIIFLPIIIITSYYIQKQVDTIDLQLSYDSKLLDATYDAMTAFEINTANEDLSTVSDSLRGIIEASNSIFLNTLATNLGYSNASISYVQPYVPAVLYTLYDGFYIYAPSNEPEILTDSYGQTITTDKLGVHYEGLSNGRGIYTFVEKAVNYGEAGAQMGLNDGYSESVYTVDYTALEHDRIESEYGQLLYKNKDENGKVTYSTTLSDDTYYKQDYILKSYVPYSANYKSEADKIDVTINYTLDNYISVTGTIGDVYYSKSGYLIADSLIKKITVDGSEVKNWYDYSDETLEDYIYNPDEHEVTVTFNDGTEISNKTTYITTDDEISVREKYGFDIYWDDTQDAVEYYVDSWMFSEWVYDTLGNSNDLKAQNYWGQLTGKDETTGENYTLNKEEGTGFLSNLIESVEEDTDIFASGQNPEGESTFESHREKIIKNSINYNLALAILTYSDMRTLVDYDMPIFTEDDWNKILNNVTVVSLMQGLSCGLKYYNNYAVAVSTNNEVTVTTSEIYYVPIQKEVEYADGNGEPSGMYLYTDISDDYIDYIDEEKQIYPIEREIAHRIDCPNLLGTDDEELTHYYYKPDGSKVFTSVDEDLYYISFRSKEIKYDKVYDKDRRNLCL